MEKWCSCVHVSSKVCRSFVYSGSITVPSSLSYMKRWASGNSSYSFSMGSNAIILLNISFDGAGFANPPHYHQVPPPH